jgi:hypothetical protein
VDERSKAVLRLRLLASAFSPMLVIFAIRATEQSWLLAAVLLLLAVIAALGGLLLISERSLTNAQPFTIVGLRDESSQVPAYLLTDLFPFVTVGATTWQDWAVYLFFAAFLVLVLVRTDLVLVNPVLLALGYHLYVIESTTRQGIVMVSTRRPAVGQTIEAVHLTKGAVKLVSVVEH